MRSSVRTTLLAVAVGCLSSFAHGQVLLSDDWEDGVITDSWHVYGDPQPYLYEGGPARGMYSLNANGDGWYDSGAACLQRFEIQGGLTVEHWLNMHANGEEPQAYHQSGLWHLSDLMPKDFMDGVDGSHDNLPQINYSCESDVSTLSFHLGYMNFHVIDSTPYFGQWTKFTWVIGDDGTIDYFINDELLVSSEAGMAAPLFGTEATLAIRGRSVGTTILNDDTVVFVPPPDYDLTLHEPLPGIAGGPNSFQVSECTFGETVVLKYSLKTGTADIAGCPGIYFELDSPKLVGSAVANYFGDAWITVPIPGVASGLTVHLQAYEKGTCLISNPLEYTFE